MKLTRELSALVMVPLLASMYGCGAAFSEQPNSSELIKDTVINQAAVAPVPEKPAPLTVDSASFSSQLAHITNGDSSGRWPVKSPLPMQGAILPYKRIIAYYGNLYSTRMGILGELPPQQMTDKLQQEVKKWEAADPNMPVQPALHYIAVTAQGSPGKGGKYRLRMPFHQIDSVLNMAKKIDAIVFLDIQVGLSSLQEEIPLLEKYLSMPNVHLGIDPEFSMKGGQAPGKVIGTFDAADINYASKYLSELVKNNNLPPKVLVVHRFTRPMVTNYQQIEKRSEVQLVIHMDGWGAPARKVNTYKQFVAKEPVEYTGFKLFYKNDLKEAPSRLMTPEELVKLKPMPVYIQYQ
ncbi:hypothetical protein KJS94_04010 [Flavihumibacter rivuli]|uniref:hypothetical protein n=1 Tax=Flavihumibacter rivuli TaxID=2838156 RepID=UPI001BDF5F8E|nr:hypothetical protein [Flavihumibacter rivuli]ULQ57365.1 hypothetical protein KJS94_04010 [Flavihumibacter rivuli]